MTPTFDVRWPIRHDGWIPLQHHYQLLAAVSRIVPDVHRTGQIGIHAIRGIQDGPGRLSLTERSAVVVRTPLAFIPKLMPLSGKKLNLAGCPVRLSVPSLHVVTASEAVFCPTVTIKGFMEPEPFREAVFRQLDTMEVRRSISLEIGSRRIIRVKNTTIVGFGLQLGGLDADESLRIQAIGLGGRRHLGCGIFLPVNRSIMRQNRSFDDSAIQ